LQKIEIETIADKTIVKKRVWEPTQTLTEIEIEELENLETKSKQMIGGIKKEQKRSPYFKYIITVAVLFLIGIILYRSNQKEQHRLKNEKYLLQISKLYKEAEKDTNNTITLEKKKKVWQKFLEKLSYDSPYSEIDNEMRRKAKERLSFLSKVNYPKKWDYNVWKECWLEDAGYIDFTGDAWQKLSHKEQVEKASAYQQWYAQYKKLSLHKEFRVSETNFKMVLIPPGKFLMGSPKSEKSRKKDRENQHRVIISKPFYLATTEVTQKQWYNVTGERLWSGQKYTKDNPNHAVSYVSWDDVKKKFLPKLSGEFGLPTEAQWEYACRSGTLARFYWGDNSNANEIGKYAWYVENAWGKGHKYAHPIRQKLANGWGLYDMSGNVYEWCEDVYDKKAMYTNDQINPVVYTSGGYRVIRGGFWRYRSHYLRSSSRDCRKPDTRAYYVGFRFFSPK